MARNSYKNKQNWMLIIFRACVAKTKDGAQNKMVTNSYANGAELDVDYIVEERNYKFRLQKNKMVTYFCT